MTEWSELRQATLLGTRRAKLPQAYNNKHLQQLIEQLDGQNPAHDLLSIAGTLTLYDQVGQLPVYVDTATTTALPHPGKQSTCSHQTTHHLLQMLNGPMRTLLPEFLSALAHVNKCVPPAILPNLLAHGAKFSVQRPQIIAVIGRYGRWLAAQNPEWSYATTHMESWSELTKQWTQLTLPKQQTLLRQLRATDPQRGRELLNEIWKTETAPTRLRLIKILQTGLSMADEPFLEMALDDRSHLVRRQAADMLASLPNSRLCQRMAKNALNFLSWTPQSETQITLRFPPVTPQMVRDGVVGVQSKELARVRSRQLVQMVSAVPLDYWTSTWGVTPAEIVRAIPTTRWTRTLTSGFSMAAQRQNNSVWAKTILQQLGFDMRTNRLIGALTEDDCFAITQEISNSREQWLPLTKDDPLFNILRYWQRPFNITFARFWLQTIADHVRYVSNPGTNVMLRSILMQFSRNCPPSLADEAAEILLPTLEANETWRNSIEEIVRILRFRQEMIAAIAQEYVSNG